jgi:CDP-4-dehydro-6-deoxyglucose reductase
LANAPKTDNTLELHIQAVDGGAMTDYWFNRAKVNDLLRLNGPLGTFFLRDTAKVNLICLATGTGIAPVKSMLESLSGRLVDQRPRSVTVLWGGRVPEDLYFDVAGMPLGHKFVPVLSRADATWPGARGYVQHALLAMQPDLGNAVVYACGSAAMIHSSKELLVQNGLPAKRFYSDAFVCSSS